jgi:hypothetical protein
MPILALVNEMLADMTDVRTKLEIANTINFLYNIFSTGKITEEQLRADLKEIVTVLVENRYPEMTDEEKRQKIEEIVGMFMRQIKLETLARRMAAKASQY